MSFINEPESNKLFGSKINNRQAVIDLLLKHGAVSRVDIARLTHFSRPTVSAVIAELMEEGVIREVGFGESTGGRKPTLLRLGGEGKLVVGIEIDSDKCHIVLVDLDGRVLNVTDCTVPFDSTVDDVLNLIVQSVEDIFAGRPRRALLGCGVAVPGLVSTEGDRIIFSSHLGWENVPLTEQLEARLQTSIMMTNRGKAAALGTLWLRGRDKQDDLIYVYLGTGVGGGIILDRKVLSGASQTAGEIGHICVDPNGPLCKCGNYGCLETYVSGSAIAMRTRAKIRAGQPSLLQAWSSEHGLEALTTKMVAQAALEGDPLALEILNETAMYLGIALANAINLVNPQTVVLGGPVARWGGLLIDAVRHEVQKRALLVSAQTVQIVAAEDDGLAVPVGASALVIRSAGQLLAIPQS